MPNTKALTRPAVLLALALAQGLCAAQPPAPAPSFTIAAPNVTMSSSGTSSILFTLTSVNGFAGTLIVGITQPTVPAGTKLPYLEEGGPARDYPLVANGTATGSFGALSAVPVPEPVKFNLPNRPAHGEAVRWKLAGVLILSLGFLRKRSRPSTRLLLALCMLIALTAISACGGPPTLTPGTYTYTLTATELTPSVLSPSSSTTMTVTVMPGIATK
jgi:hypothetical protein